MDYREDWTIRVRFFTESRFETANRFGPLIKFENESEAINFATKVVEQSIYGAADIWCYECGSATKRWRITQETRVVGVDVSEIPIDQD